MAQFLPGTWKDAIETAKHYSRKRDSHGRDILRRCRFAPYRKGMGPTFSLVTWDTHRRDDRGGTYTGYELREGEELLFSGEDFSSSPMDATDSDDSIRSLMVFLTLRPGDTDAEYFDGYTERQLQFCQEHAETLGWYVEGCWHGGSEESRG